MLRREDVSAGSNRKGRLLSEAVRTGKGEILVFEKKAQCPLPPLRLLDVPDKEFKAPIHDFPEIHVGGIAFQNG